MLKWTFHSWSVHQDRLTLMMTDRQCRITWCHSTWRALFRRKWRQTKVIHMAAWSSSQASQESIKIKLNIHSQMSSRMRSKLRTRCTTKWETRLILQRTFTQRMTSSDNRPQRWHARVIETKEIKKTARKTQYLLKRLIVWWYLK